MINHDQLICKVFFKDNNKLSNNYWKFIIRIKKDKYNNIKNYLINRYNDLTIESKTIFKESLYRILNKIDIRPKCKTCGNNVSFNPSKLTCYNDHCSASCEMKDYNVIKKHNQSCLEKYGSVNNIRKSQQTKLKRYNYKNYNNSELRNKTNINRYGYKCSLQNSAIKEKTIKTNIARYQNQFPQKNKNIKEKIKNSNINTCIKKYNVDNIMKINLINKKRIITLLSNHTFTISKPENESYQLLKEKYPDVIHQYRSKVYPFSCDFYIPSLDLYIECNYHWTHGKHLYNKDSKEDNIILEKWKSKGTKYYNNAINTWTIRDPEKYNIAKKNNLNYLLFYNIDNLKEWLVNNGKH